MSHQPSHGPTHTVHASKGGSPLKWLAIAGVAALVLGGSYYAWKNLGPAQTQSSEIAYNTDSVPADSFDSASTQTAGPIDDTTSSNLTSDTSSATPAAAPARRRTAARTTPAVETVPEQVVGVTPASATFSDEEAIIVQGRRAPQWTRTPSAYRLSTAYPTRLLERGREGEATVHCTVEQAGTLDCVRATETASGFGAAALRVARMFRHAPQRADGSSAIGTPVNLRVVFRMADEPRRG